MDWVQNGLGEGAGEWFGWGRGISPPHMIPYRARLDRDLDRVHQLPLYGTSSTTEHLIGSGETCYTAALFCQAHLHMREILHIVDENFL